MSSNRVSLLHRKQIFVVQNRAQTLQGAWSLVKLEFFPMQYNIEWKESKVFKITFKITLILILSGTVYRGYDAFVHV